jgi:hypothetical protein
MSALTFGLAGDLCDGCRFSLSAAASNCGGIVRPMFNGKTVQVGVREDACRFGQDLLSGVSAGNVAVED